MADEETTKTITIGDVITVGDLAKQLDLPVTTLIGELFKNGVMATVNESIDFDTAQIIVGEIDPAIQLEREVVKEVERVRRVTSDAGVLRPPVVAVMGHVDHGKTSLLDAIRGGEVAKHEAGGITQHISAYQVEHNGRKVTFLDTPGHEAFSALREHGATLTDVAIIVVAADDGIKPQTEEAIRFAKKAGVKMVVAANKVDKEGADVNRLKQQLSEAGLLTEEWGGDTIVVEVSAKTKQGIDQLLDMVLLVADVEELKADEDTPAEGLIIEAHMEQGRGAVASALVEHGFLSPGSYVQAGAAYAKIRTLEDTTGKKLESAGPSTPVTITGFKKLPQFGDLFRAFADEKAAKAAAAEFAANSGVSATGRPLATTGTDLIKMMNKQRDVSVLNVVLKADVQGSLTSVIGSLHTLENDEVKIRVVGQGVGNINESDISLAAASEAVVYGFNVSLPANVKQLTAREKVSVRMFNVIYELLDDAKAELSAMLSPEVVETEVGRLIVRGVFRTSKDGIICGGEVTKGKAIPGALVKIYRDKEELAEAQVTKVQRGQAEAKEVFEGEMCGLELKTTSKIQLEEGDRLEFITRETVARKL